LITTAASSYQGQSDIHNIHNIHKILYIHQTRISKSTININKPSTDMAQNINMQYVFMQNAGVLAPGRDRQINSRLVRFKGQSACIAPTQAVERLAIIS